MILHPDWITGFVDGEGCFHIGISNHPEMTTGYQILPEFTIVQHENDVQVLHAIKTYFKCGVVRTYNGDRMAYRVRGLEHLCNIIVPFFERHPLRTKKRIDFEKFRNVLQMMKQQQHLSPEGVEKIKSIAGDMNRKQIKIKSELHGDMQRVPKAGIPSPGPNDQDDVTN